MWTELHSGGCFSSMNNAPVAPKTRLIIIAHAPQNEQQTLQPQPTTPRHATQQVAIIALTLHNDSPQSNAASSVKSHSQTPPQGRTLMRAIKPRSMHFSFDQAIKHDK